MISKYYTIPINSLGGMSHKHSSFECSLVKALKPEHYSKINLKLLS